LAPSTDLQCIADHCALRCRYAQNAEQQATTNKQQATNSKQQMAGTQIWCPIQTDLAAIC
jgi:hypothetical protein